MTKDSENLNVLHVTGSGLKLCKFLCVDSDHECTAWNSVHMAL